MDPLELELSTYEATGELLPGGAAALAKAWSDLKNRPPAVLAEKVAERLSSTEATASVPGLYGTAQAKVVTIADRYQNPEYRPAKGAPVRAVLERYSGKLREGVIDELVTKLGPETNHLSAHKIVRKVVEWLGRPESHDYLKERPPASANELRIAGIVAAHFPEADAVGFARAYARDFVNQSDERGIVRTIALRLSMAPYVRFLTTKTALSKSDPRLTYNPPKPRESAGTQAMRRLSGM